MPAMISHYLIGCDVLEQVVQADSIDRDLFLLGTQGPDIFYFSRAYPWLPGKKGLPVGNALHEASPSLLVDALRAAVDAAPATERRAAESYALGFLCHYAADRTIHPFVCAMQERMMAEDPSYAEDRNPYHYRIESALDTLILRRERGERVERFRLTRLIPSVPSTDDAVLAAWWERVIDAVLCQPADVRALRKLRADMRHSMWWMTDRFGLKHTAFRVMETLFRKDAWYSSLIRTPRVDWYDFANTAHRAWGEGKTADIYELYARTVALTLDILRLWNNGADGRKITQDIDFSGHPYNEGDTL